MAARIPLVINSGAIQELQSGDSLNLGPNASLTSPTIATSMILSYGTANQVQFLNGSKQLVGDADFTFDGTTLSATNFTSSGTVTLSGGTANGVAYLNGSKVLTTGSALTFDGTTITNTVGTFSSTNGSGGTGYFGAIGTAFRVTNLHASSATQIIGNGEIDIYTAGGSPIVFTTAGAEQMRLTSTGLGIGTSSPAVKLDVASASTTQIRVQMSGQADMRIGSDTGVARIGTYSAHPLLFYTNTTEQMRLDSSGNLGLGVTPSAWVTTTASRGMQFGRGASVFYSTDQAQSSFGGNYYQDGANSYKYLTAGYALKYSQNDYNGVHSWFTAPSGTAGNAISFTQAMTLDASGNLMVGTTSASGIVTSKGAGFSNPPFYATDGTGALRVTFNAVNYASVPANKPWIHSYQDMYLGSDAGINIAFVTSATERMRIDSSGNLLVGATSNPYSVKTYFVGNNGQGVAVFKNPDTAYGARTIQSIVDTAGSTNYYHFSAADNASDCFIVYGNGNVVNRNNSYGAISDIKLKENVVDATPKLAGLMQVRVVNYNFKTNPEQKQLGVVAQELEQVFPGMVDETADKDAEGNGLGTSTKSVKYSVFVPMLIKAIQELKAELDATKAEVAALKGA